MNSKAKKITIISAISLGGLIVACVLGFLIYAGFFYYRADSTAHAVLESRQDIVEKDGLIYVPSTTTSTTGIIFYLGANVEAIAYLPLADKLSSSGVNVIIVKMPLNFAIFNVDGADQVIKTYTDIDKWYMCGHSLGGAMASVYASDNQDKVSGLIVLGAYVYGDYPTQNSLTIYGEFNDAFEHKIDMTGAVEKITGGNHAQFGNYGKQLGDADATISAESQQQQTVEAIISWL